jgi:hypothetical protein
MEQRYHQGSSEGPDPIVWSEFVVDYLMRQVKKNSSVLFRACREEMYHSAWEHVRHVQHKV